MYPSLGETTIYATVGTCYTVWMTVWYAGCILHINQSPIQNNMYQMSHKYSCFPWWWVHSRPKHVEKRNKHTKKNCAPGWLYLQDYTGFHGKQNIKIVTNILSFFHLTDYLASGFRLLSSYSKSTYLDLLLIRSWLYNYI